MELKSILAMILVAGCTFSRGAKASPVWNITTKGTIQQSWDYTGVFGGADKSLDGLEFTQLMTVSVDPTKYSSHDVADNFNWLYGYDNPFTVTVTVNDKTVNFNIVNSAYQEQYIQNNATAKVGGYDYIYSSDHGFDGANGNYLSVYSFAYAKDTSRSFGLNLDFEETVQFINQPNVKVGSNFYLQDKSGNYLATINTYADSIAFVASDTADVPEPESISLFGLGLIGLSIMPRRKSRQATVV